MRKLQAPEREGTDELGDPGLLEHGADIGQVHVGLGIIGGEQAHEMYLYGAERNFRPVFLFML